MMFRTIALRGFVLVVVLSAALKVQTQDTKAPYPSMAPLDQYLMADRDAEISLARSAAPQSISRDAEVLVLGRHGYETAVKGKNGFVCIVERSWTGPFDDPGFWNPKIRGPICFNPPAARTILPFSSMRTDLVLAGKSKAEVRESIKAAFRKKELPAMEPGAMAYMMSKDAYLTDAGGHNLAHLMFFVPVIDGAALGADLPGSPVLLFNGSPDPEIRVFLVGTAMWSDGTAAPRLAAH